MNADSLAAQLVAALRRENDALADASEVRAELADLRNRVESLLSWGNGRDTGGVDRLIPAADLRAALTAGSDA